MQPDYIDIMLKAQAEWPEQKLQTFILDYLRENCEWAINKRNELEVENKEARSKGISYQERKNYSVKIEALNHLFQKWKERGLFYKKHPLSVASLLAPEDLEYIHSVGVEKHIQSVVSW